MTWQACGYGCDKPWRPWKGSKLIGHARCARTPAQKRTMLERMERDPKVTMKRIAAEEDVTEAIVRAWVRQALAERARRCRTCEGRGWVDEECESAIAGVTVDSKYKPICDDCDGTGRREDRR